MSAETSDRVSAIAAGLANINGRDIMEAGLSLDRAAVLASKIRTVATSALRQDTTPGQRRAPERKRLGIAEKGKG